MLVSLDGLLVNFGIFVFSDESTLSVESVVSNV